MSKAVKNSNQQSKLFKFLSFPIYLYFGVYVLSLLIAVLNGGRPVLLSLITNNFEDDGIRQHTLRNAGVFYNVATKEIEDCDTNPMEYYPMGHVDETREYGRGLIYAYDVFKLSSFGMPKRKVESGHNCLENSQKITTSDIEGKHSLSNIAINLGLRNWTTPEGIEKKMSSQTEKSYNDENYFLELNTDSEFLFSFGCLTITGMYQLEKDALHLSNIEKQLSCTEDQLTEEQSRISEILPTILYINVYPSTLQFSNDESSLSFAYLK
jgi:hypothetical protein